MYLSAECETSIRDINHITIFNGIAAASGGTVSRAEQGIVHNSDDADRTASRTARTQMNLNHYDYLKSA